MAKEEDTGRHATVYRRKQQEITDHTDITSPSFDRQVHVVDGRRISGLLTMPMDVFLEVGLLPHSQQFLLPAS